MAGLGDCSDVETQKRELGSLHAAVDARASEVDALLERYRSQLEAQRLALAQQEASIQVRQ